MKLQLICAGKVKDAWLRDAISEYTKRLSRFCTVSIVEVPDAPDHLPREQALKKEGDAMLSKIKPSSLLWLMDLAGVTMNSEQFSEILMKGFDQGGSELTIMIGGSNGFAKDVLDRASFRIRFSDMTMTHTMARLFLIEQCYRAFKIDKNESYHK
ncbi:MAG TPA: 23S rRNA (pseudouridine(1915)-N(3))-methyltransferase RlmH [Clostridiaceae bacterium]|jgi:23S rRNA (pseudouridine1915-N3)-methyltransferase|nr:23S rRNA (pseudouridine(1915)-N(3))-methyltransferase RlmH [Clostridiaceae bacterium]